MQFLLAVFAALQIAQPPAAGPVRGDRFQIAVPQGWKMLSTGEDILVEHSTGASILVRRISPTKNLMEFAQLQAERVMAPLGFAKLGEPRNFKDVHDEWVQYEIQGNRLAEHRRILYRALRRDNAYFEMVYEAGEDHFNALITDAMGIAASVQAIITAPPQPTRRTGARR